MPLFKYRCNECQEQFEELVSFSESQNVECPNCKSMKMRRNGTCMLCEDCGTTTGCS